MGFLAPFYALAALAVVGPIIFHLIQRQPKGSQPFSSHMFLSPAKPQLTRRSRLDNWPLLLLRALVLLLLALAFTRPYWRQESLVASSLDGQTVAIVVDTSGSMRRDGLWEAAVDRAAELLDDLAPNDRAALYTIGHRLTAVVPVGPTNSSDGLQTQADVRAALGTLRPTFSGTNLSDGLIEVAQRLHALSIEESFEAGRQSNIALVSDLHQRCNIDGLQGFQWPGSVTLDVRQVAATSPGNAYMSLVATDDSAAIRVRVTNTQDSADSLFQIQWLDAQDRELTSTKLQVPSGQSRVITVGEQPVGADALRLSGDKFDADNSIFFAKQIVERQDVLFVGNQELPVEERLDYFLLKLPLSTESVDRDIRTVELADLSTLLANESTTAVIVEVNAATERSAEVLRRYAENGGTVLLCLARDTTGTDSVAPAIDALLNVSGTIVSESMGTGAADSQFSLLASVDYRHRIFAPFADPRYNDFSKLRFWNHRTVVLPAAAADGTPDAQATTPASNRIQTLATLDSGAPLLLEQTVGKGNMWLLTAGWHPKASGLGVSSKFVPIMLGLLERTNGPPQKKPTYKVDEQIACVPDARILESTGQPADVDEYEKQDATVSFLRPGKYLIEDESQVRQEIAIAMPDTESLVTPLDSEVFEQFGVSTKQMSSQSQRVASQQQLKNEQLESKQRLWQWLLACGGAVLAIESILGVFLRSGAAAN